MRVSLKLCLVVGIVFASGLALFGQVTGSITGTIRDGSSAMAPNAKETVFNTVRHPSRYSEQRFGRLPGAGVRGGYILRQVDARPS